MNKKVKNITLAAMIAACYVVITYIFAFCASGTIQVRVAEALCVLPCFTPAAIPGVTLGCLISNILTGCMPYDVLFGTLATLIGAVFTYLLRKHKYLSVIPPIVSNTIVIPQVLKYVYQAEESVPFLTLTIFAGEFISIAVLGSILIKVLEKHSERLFG